MSGVMQFEFRLFGPRKGQTMVINGHSFINGIATLVQSSDNMGSCARVFSFYNCYARGTPGYDKALALEESENGTGEVDTTTVKGVDPSVSASVQSDGGRSPEGETAPSAGYAITDRPDSAGVGASGDGHEYTGVPKFPEDENYRAEEPASQVNMDVASAIKQLDPEVDSHWVMTGAHKGKPKLQAVEDVYGKATLTRQDIEAAMPGYDRDVALEAALVS